MPKWIHSKLRRPSKDNKKDWIRIQMLFDHGYDFKGWPTKEMWFELVERSPVPQTMAELELAFIDKKIVRDHKEFKKLKNKYYKERTDSFNILPQML